MATNTPNYNLVKPELNDFADIRVLNGNMDIIDAQLKKASDIDLSNYATKPELNNYLPLTGGNLSGDITILDKPVLTIIEQVTNDEQVCTKYGDGTLMTRINHSNVVGQSWIVNFLVPFVDTNYVATASAYGVGTTDYDNLEYCELNQKTSTSIEVKTSTRAGGRVATDYSLICIGRWK